MQHSEFIPGEKFWFNGKWWRCTDIGKRVIVAIALDHDHDPSWYNGPPYAVSEQVFDEYDRVKLANLDHVESLEIVLTPSHSLGNAATGPRATSRPRVISAAAAAASAWKRKRRPGRL